MVAARRSLTPRRSRSLGRRHQRDHAECRMVVVVALVEAHAAALVEGEGRVGRRAKSFGGRGHGIGQRQPEVQELAALEKDRATQARYVEDRKSTRLNSSHRCISYAVFCLKKKKR